MRNLKPATAAEVLAKYRTFTGTTDTTTVAVIEKKISKLEAEAAYQMALETFLDCDNVKVIAMRKARPSERLNKYTAK